MFLAKKPTKKEIADQYKAIFDKLDSTSSIDIFYAKETEYGLKRFIKDKLDMVDYLINHRASDFELTSIEIQGLQFLNQEVKRAYNKTVHQYRRFTNNDSPIYSDRDYFNKV